MHGGSANRVCQLAGIEIPILQAPMTYIAGAQLASAVSDAGALGIIETASDEGREDLRRVRDLTDRPVGANIALIMMRDPGVVDLLVEAGVRFVTTSAGDPALFTARLQDAGIVVFHVVGTLRSARKAVDAGVDGLIVEGVEGGGFKNRFGASTMVLLPLIAAAVDVPIVAAGGICDARSMAAAFVLGAEAVQMGTRLLASRESPVHDNFKTALLDADETGTMLLPLAGTRTMRVIRTPAAERVDRTTQSGAAEAAPMGAAVAQRPGAEGAKSGDAASFDLSAARAAEKATVTHPRTLPGLDTVRRLYFEGDMNASLANTGQVAGRIDAIRPVADIIRETWGGCADALADAATRLTP